MTTKRHHLYLSAIAAMLTAAPFATSAAVYFSDTFSSGSTLNSASPANPTPTSTAYELVANKAWNPNPPTIAANDLKFGIGATTAGYIQAQALFTNSPVALVLPGDYIQLTVVFTNTSGLLTAAGQLGFGLYNSGQVKPVAGGINNSSPATFTGFAQGWVGYCADINFTGASSRLMTRPAQSGTTIANQDLFTFGTSSSYASGATIGSTTANATLTAGSVYTEVLTITLNDVNSLAITNVLYAGPNTGGTVVTNFGSVATNTTFLTSGFDALVIGYCGRGNTGGNPLFDVSSVQVAGSVSTITTPPTITAEPVPVTVATNGSCYFQVQATGVNVTYQWFRNNGVITNSANISGATSGTLTINNANIADAFSGVNGYYCVVTGAGNYSTNSTTNSLTLVPKKNLEWNGTGANWDFVTTDWNDLGNGNNPTNFNYGDAVTFDDLGAGNANVTLNDKFLSASTFLISGSTAYAFNGPGYMGGAGQLIFNSSAVAIQMLGTNAHTGGTIISNNNPSLLLYCALYGALGSGPLTLAKPGSLEIVPTGSATTGIAGNVVVNDDFTLQFDGTGTFAGVVLGDISGVTGKTLTLSPQNTSATNRYRFYGSNTVCAANIAINPNGTLTSQAQYDGTVFAPYGNGTQTYNGVISGFGGIIQRNGTSILNNANTYSGGTTPTTGAIGLGNNQALGTGPLVIAPEVPGTSGTGGALFASGGARTIGNSLVYPSGTNNLTLFIGGTNDITFTSALNLNGLDNTGNPGSRTIQVTNTGTTTFSGIISDSSANNIGLNKTGNGALTLSGANNYTGPTVVSSGTLLVNGSIGAGAVTVTNATLGGTGTIGGAVTVQTNASLAPGNNAIGTLTINNTLTLAGGSTTRVEINKTSSTSDRVNVTTVSYNGTLAVTNLSGTLTTNDQFTLFSATTPSGNFTNVTGFAGSGLGFTFNPATGVLKVVQTIATNPTNITFAVSGNNLSLTWPGDHLGWELQSNAVSLTTTSAWFVVPNSTTVTNVSMPVDASKTNVFYRLHLP